MCTGLSEILIRSNFQSKELLSTTNVDIKEMIVRGVVFSQHKIIELFRKDSWDHQVTIRTYHNMRTKHMWD